MADAAHNFSDVLGLLLAWGDLQVEAGPADQACGLAEESPSV